MKSTRLATTKTSAISLVSILQTFLVIEIIVTVIVIINTHIVIDKNDEEIRALESGLERAMTIVIPTNDVMEKVEKDEEVIVIPEESPEIQVITFESDSNQETIAVEKNNISSKIYDKEILAQIMFAEEGVFLRQYDSNPEMVERVFKLAGSVVINRVKTNFLGAKSISDVIYEKGQYAKQTQDRVRNGQDVPDIVYTWADDLLTNGTIGPEGLVYQAEFEQGQVYEKIGNQVFGIK